MNIKTLKNVAKIILSFTYMIFAIIGTYDLGAHYFNSGWLAIFLVIIVFGNFESVDIKTIGGVEIKNSTHYAIIKNNKIRKTLTVVFGLFAIGYHFY